MEISVCNGKVDEADFNVLHDNYKKLEVECKAWNGKYEELVEIDKKTELECQKWKEKFIGIEKDYKNIEKRFSLAIEENRVLEGYCEKWEQKYIEENKKLQKLEQKQIEPVISKEDYEKLVKENKDLDILLLSFRIVLEEIFRRRAND